MNVALLLSGHLRNYEVSYKNLKKHIIDVFDPDIFIHTWNNRGNVIKKYCSDTKLKVNKENVISTYFPKEIVFEDFNEIDKKVNKNYEQNSVVPVSNIVHMYRKMALVNNIKNEYCKKNNIKYDLVIRARPDLIFESPIPEEELGDIKDFTYVPDTSNKQINDHLCFSSEENVDFYCSLYYNIDKYYQGGLEPPNTTKTGCPLHAETMLNFHLKKNKLKETNIKYYITHKRKGI